MGALDGLTILRYGHVYDDGGGGMEQYIHDLNRALLGRSSVCIHQLELTSNPHHVGSREVAVGSDRLRTESLFVNQNSHEEAIAGSSPSLLREGLRAVRNRLLQAPGIRTWITKPYVRGRAPRRRPGEPEGAGDAVRRIHSENTLDLICLHSAGGGDAEEIIRLAGKIRVPIVYIHHFSNDRLAGLVMRDQIARLDGVAGVTGIGVPSHVRGRFRNVADGIDTDWMDPAQEAPKRAAYDEPLLFLPARISPSKGQADVIRLAIELDRCGIRARVAFAGRTDNPNYIAILKKMIVDGGLADRVSFLGQLGREELRRAYAEAILLVFPTRHHEGLPRILMESQAMGLPVVGYEMGGMKEGLVEESTGFLVTPGNFAGLRNRTLALLKDPQRLEKMGAAARDFAVRRFALASLAERHEQFYRAALEGRAR